MNEEIMVNEEMEITENVENTEEETAEIESSGIAGKVILGLVAGAVTGAAVLLKNRHKIEAKIDERRIRKLEKQGYRVTRLHVVDDPDENDDVQEDPESNEE